MASVERRYAPPPSAGVAVAAAVAGRSREYATSTPPSSALYLQPELGEEVVE